MITESESSYNQIYKNDGGLVIEEPLKTALLDKLGVDFCCLGEENTYQEHTIERLDPVRSDIIDQMIVVSENYIDIVSEECENIIVNFY